MSGGATGTDGGETEGMGTHVLVELEGLVHLAREAIDQESAAAVLPRGTGATRECVAHGVLEELDGDLHRDDRPVLDAVLDELAELGALAVLLRAQEVAGWSGSGGDRGRHDAWL